MPKRRALATRRPTVHSNTYRFFTESANIHGRDVQIADPELAHQLINVLRLDSGDQILLLDNTGWQFVVSLTSVSREEISGTVERKELAEGEPHTKITLYLALMRPEKFEWVLQKGTEIGVSAFVPLISERSLISDANELSDRKIERWQRVIREAAEQSRRGKLPRLAPAVFLSTACEQAVQRGTALLLWEGEHGQPLRQALTSAKTTPAGSVFSLSVFSGPEGGFAPHELEAARGYGMIPVTLGPRTLRAETAPLAAASAILYEMGDMG